MIEIGTSIQREHAPLLRRAARPARRSCRARARKLNIAIAGGGTHAVPALERAAASIPTERFHYISELYGYLAKQFTVFGQHVHVGCANGDTRAVAAARAVALRAALHRAVGVVAVRAGRGHRLRFGAAELGVRVSAVGPRAVRRSPGTSSAHFFDKMTSTGVVAVDEGLLLGHPAQARVRHHRAARVRHAAHGRQGRGAGLLPAVPVPLPARGEARSSRPRTTTWSTPSTASRPAASASTARSSTRRPSSATSCATTSCARWRASTSTRSTCARSTPAT